MRPTQVGLKWGVRQDPPGKALLRGRIEQRYQGESDLLAGGGADAAIQPGCLDPPVQSQSRSFARVCVQKAVCAYQITLALVFR